MHRSPCLLLRTPRLAPSGLPLRLPSRHLHSTPPATRKATHPLPRDHDAPPPQAHTPAPVSLRPYQQECIDTLLKAIADGRRQVGVSLATGAGKTVIFTELIGQLPPPTPTATQTLILAHRRELVDQAARHCAARYPTAHVDIEMGNTHATGRADITVASVQSVNSGARIDKFDPRRFKLVLVDEAHHVAAEGYVRVLEHFGVPPKDEGDVRVPALVGVSATFSRHDGVALGRAIRHIVYHKDYIDMIGEQWLAPPIFTTVQSGADISRVQKAKDGDFNTSSLSKAVNKAETNLVTVRSWLARAADRKSTLVFCVDIQHVLDIAATFRRHGVDARYVTGFTRSADRAQLIDDFKDRKFPVLVNCGVFTEGTDIPNIDCVLLARPTRSRNLLVQMIGRGMRLFPGKADCLVLDMVASIEGGIVTTPTLFGLDPAELVDRADATALREQQKARQQETQKKLQSAGDMIGMAAGDLDSANMQTNLRFTDYESVNDLISDTSGERHVRALSMNAWVSVGSGSVSAPDATDRAAIKYVLTDGTGGSYLLIEQTLAGPTPSKSDDAPFKVLLYTSSKELDMPIKAPFLRPRQLAAAATFESAVRAADTYAAKRFNRQLVQLNAKWREADASQAQVDFLNRAVGRGSRGAPADGDGHGEDELLTTRSLTKGQAGDMITKLKHGAKGVWRQIQTMRRRREREVRKGREWEEMQRRETVQVGPLDGRDARSSVPAVGLAEALKHGDRLERASGEA